jgi:head-tail adaptor
MADVRELLARLNPTTIRYDTGKGGGAPELTNIDIAGALGFVAAGLGREVLESCYLSDVVRPTRRLREIVVAMVREEWDRQGRQLMEAKTNLALAKVIAGWGGAITADQRREVDRCRAKFEAVRAAMWPDATGERLPAILLAVLQDVGRGGMSDRGRAEAIGVSWSTYRSAWAPVYRWMLQQMLEAEQEAADQLAAALRRGQAA